MAAKNQVLRSCVLVACLVFVIMSSNNHADASTATVDPNATADQKATADPNASADQKAPAPSPELLMFTLRWPISKGVFFFLFFSHLFLNALLVANKININRDFTAIKGELLPFLVRRQFRRIRDNKQEQMIEDETSSVKPTSSGNHGQYYTLVLLQHTFITCLSSS